MFVFYYFNPYMCTTSVMIAYLKFSPVTLFLFLCIHYPLCPLCTYIQWYRKNCHLFLIEKIGALRLAYH